MLLPKVENLLGLFACYSEIFSPDSLDCVNIIVELVPT